MNEFEELAASVHEIRAEKFPNVDADLVSQILAAEAENIDDETAASGAVTRIVNAHFEQLEG